MQEHRSSRRLPRAVVGIAMTVASLLSTTLHGCEPDYVEPDPFTPSPPRGDAGMAPDLPSRSPDGAAGGADGAPDGPADASAADAPAPAVPVDGTDAGCDLAGRWLVAQRILVTAAGQQQSAQTWYYYELRQQGTELTVTRGLHCGYQVVKKSALGASVDSSGAWPAFLARNSSTGRRGTVSSASNGCRFTLAREYVVRGATLPHYADPAIKLPDRTQAASSGTPGWEDWDGDGNPGISIRVSSSLASGTLYDCQREWSEYDGTLVPGASKFKIPIAANNEHVVLGRSAGSPQTLESSSSLASDATQHYAWFHRLQDQQATGSDAEICSAIRSLKDQLVPEAAQ